MLCRCAPDEDIENVLILVPVNISCSSHIFPGNLWMTPLDGGGQSSRSFGNDLQPSYNGINGPPICLELIK